MGCYIGVDLGGTNLRAALVDTGSGRILTRRSCLTHAAEGQDQVIHRIAQLLQELICEGEATGIDVRAIGIGVPGTPDFETGTIVLLTNLPGQWLNVPLQTLIEAHVGLPVALINDARAMTLGEWTFGAGRGAQTVVCLTIGTGIGGGVIANSQFHLGIGGTAGEFGHQVVEPNGPPCGCGGRGCLELYASGPAIAAMGIKEVIQGHTTCISELAGGDLNKITAELIFQAAQEGDRIAQDILGRAGRYLGIAVGNILGIISPQRVIFGGGVSQTGSLLLEHVRATVKERAYVIPVDRVEFVIAELGNDAGMIGAALWAERRIMKERG